MSDEEHKYYIGFNLVKGIGSMRMRLLLDRFESAEQAWKAPFGEIKEAGLSARLAEGIETVRKSDALEKTWEEIQAKKIQVITWEDPEYPRRLKEVDQPPPVLYILGGLRDEDQWAAAVVGTRQISAYGRQVTEELGRSLAQNGVTVVSGLARGVDAVAHQAALKNGGRTIAVLGSGVDEVYPPEHRNLAAQIMEHGALISDYPPGTPPDAANFPARNRIISGLSQAVVVVEAGEKSGALITAGFAMAQAREVLAIPGQLYAPQSRGTNRLIHDGAKLLLDVQDVLNVMNLSSMDQTRMRQEARQALPAGEAESALYELLGREPLHVDEIRNLTEMPIEQVWPR